MNKKLWWLVGGLTALFILFIVLKMNGVLGKEQGIKVSVEKVARRTIIETVTASGKLYPEIEVKVSPDISGEIVELTVNEGDSVKRGQVLAKIYADIYTTQRDQASALVNQQQASVSNSSAQLEALKATMEQSKRAYDRQKQLLDDKVISRSEFEQAEITYLTSQANYNAAVQGIRGGEAGVISARANLLKANKDLSRTAVIAPMNGVISLLNVKKGERVVGNSMMAGTEMMRVADMSVIEVIVDVGENDIPKVHLDDSAIVEIDAYNNRTFKGTVTKIASSQGTAAAGATTANDVTNYKVHIRLLPSSYKDLLDRSRPASFPFRPGMSASADIQTKRHENVLSVPINAITTREKNTDQPPGGNKNSQVIEAVNEENSENTAGVSSSDLEEVAFVLKSDQTVKKINVRTDIQDLNYIELLSGLKEGDQVITGPYNIVNKMLKDGTKVKVVDKEKLFEAKEN